MVLCATSYAKFVKILYFGTMLSCAIVRYMMYMKQSAMLHYSIWCLSTYRKRTITTAIIINKMRIELNPIPIPTDREGFSLVR